MDLLNITIPLSIKELLINFNEVEVTRNETEIELIHAVFIEIQGWQCLSVQSKLPQTGRKNVICCNSMVNSGQ